MQDYERVQEWLDDKVLLSPSTDVGFLDFVRQFSRNLGLNVGESRPLELPIRSHSILFLVDALGLQHIEKMPCLSRLLTMQMRAVFPSTTSCALTTLATGNLAPKSGVTGWWTRLNDGTVTLPLLMQDRSTGRPLSCNVEEVIQQPACWAKLDCSRLTVMPHKLIGTSFSTFASGHSPQIGYGSWEQVPNLVLNHLKSCDHSFTYGYFPEIDHASHCFGPDSQEVSTLLGELDSMISRLVDALPSDAALFVTADHGQCDTGKPFYIKNDSTLLNYLSCPPCSEPSVPIFHVKPGFSRLFEEEFRKEFGDNFALLTHEEAISLGLYHSGSVAMSWQENELSTLRPRFGDFIAIAPKPTPLYCDLLNPRLISGIHGGLRPAEMQIPLCIFAS